MKKNTVTRIDGVPVLSVNPEFERELPPLEVHQFELLRTSIKRDGILDAIKYWFNPETSQNEIVDGHNRHKIADGKLLYTVQEIKAGSKTAILYWMHVNNAGRRGGVKDLKRMTELRQMLAEESQNPISKTQAVKDVAKDAKTSERQVWRDVAKTDDPKPTISRYDKAVRLASDLDRDELTQLRDWITTTLENG